MIPSADRLSRLVDVLLPRGGYIMSLWEAYVDESGDEHSDSVFAVAGYLIRSDKAAPMQQKWERALRRAKVPFFHMVDCTCGSGAFKGVSKERRIQILTRCIDLVRKNTELGICFLFNPPKMPNEGMTKEFSNAYSHAIVRLIGHFCHYLDLHDEDASLAIFIEQGHSTSSLARVAIDRAFFRDKMLMSGRRPSISWVSKSEACLIQAPDILAWQSAKYIKDIAKEKDRNLRKDFEALLLNSQVELIATYFVQNEMNVIRFRPEPERDEYFEAVIRSIFGEGSLQDEKMRKEFESIWQQFPPGRDSIADLFSGRPFRQPQLVKVSEQLFRWLNR